MLQYIKMIIISIFSGVMFPLPVSSAAHYSLLADVMSFSKSEEELGFYFSVFMLVFSVVVFIFLRKIYTKALKTLFVTDKAKLKEQKLTAYKKVMNNILLSLIPVIFLFIPISKDSLIIDYFDKFLTKNGFILTTFACLINALVLVISIWYTRQNNAPYKRVPETKNVVRMAVYQLISYIVPGFSHISSGSVNLLINDVHPRVIARDVYLYLAPQMFLVGLVRLVRSLVVDFVFDPILIIIAVAFSAASCAIVVYFTGKFNIRKLLGFFSIYSVLLGVVFAVATFVA